MDLRKLVDAYHSLHYGLQNARGFCGKLRAILYWLAEKTMRYLPPRIYWDLLAWIDPYQTVGLTSDPAMLYQPDNEVRRLMEERGLLRPDVVTLHIGAGVGRIEYALAPFVKKCYGIDVSRVLPRVAQRNLAAFDNVEFMTGDGHTLKPFADEMFDVVYSTIAFQHMPRRVFASYLNETERVLKPGGWLLFQIPGAAQPQRVLADDKDAHTMRRYTPRELRELSQQARGLELIEIIGEEALAISPEADLWVIARKSKEADRPPAKEDANQ